jgi:hypothetical protein
VERARYHDWTVSAHRGWTVTIDPEFEHERRTFHVPPDALFAFVASVIADGAEHLILSDGKYHLRVMRATPTRRSR